MELKTQKAIEYAYQLGGFNKSALIVGKLETNEILELWEIQETLELPKLEFNKKANILESVKECFLKLLIRYDGE